MTPAERGPRWRTVLAGVLLTVGCLVAIPATVAVWLDSVVNDTDGYVDTVGPLAADPAVQNAVTTRVTDRVMSAVGGSGPAADRLRARVEEQVGAVVAGDRFATSWTEANRAVHGRVVALLTSDEDDGMLAVRDDTVTVRLGAVVTAVQDRLVAAGIPAADRLTAGDADIVVLQSEHLPTARDWLARIDRLGTWLPVAAIVLLAAGVALARNRLRATAAAGIGLAVGMLALVVVPLVVRSRYLGTLSPTADRDAVSAVYDQLVDPLRTMSATLLLAGLALALAPLAVRFAQSHR
ncbi:hypothetical protein [Jiangella alba]|uniref:Integral membrane protein n=1 Tax=Jiangella alba TaxID=561176 RepID=A0A1H5L9X6_9ACTN|nr:hypothetical protein [Jiangella alba]SEE72998.1 hypothetical protein SAMN04488561_2452 [Jiangella alba]